MKRRATQILLMFSLVFAAGLETAVANGVPSITLDRPTYFTASDGTEIHVPPANYRIERAGDTNLRLVKEGAPPIEIQAMRVPHEESITVPLALAAMEEGQDDQLHLVLVLPGGQSLDAVGTISGTRSRAISAGVLSQSQIRVAMTAAPLPPLSLRLALRHLLLSAYRYQAPS